MGVIVMLDEYPIVLNFKQVREILHISKNLLLNLLNMGEIPGYRVGNLWRVNREDLIEYMKQR